MHLVTSTDSFWMRRSLIYVKLSNKSNIIFNWSFFDINLSLLTSFTNSLLKHYTYSTTNSRNCYGRDACIFDSPSFRQWSLSHRQLSLRRQLLTIAFTPLCCWNWTARLPLLGKNHLKLCDRIMHQGFFLFNWLFNLSYDRKRAYAAFISTSFLIYCFLYSPLNTSVDNFCLLRRVL